jgi:hypothetical protein
MKKCDSTAHSNCAPDSLINETLNKIGAFTTVFALVGTQINPSYTDGYLGYYVEARNAFQFSLNMGFRANAQVQDYEINTDASLIPIPSQIK